MVQGIASTQAMASESLQMSMANISQQSVSSGSTEMSMANTMEQVNVSTTKMAMESQQVAGQLVDEMMPQQVVSFGHKLDVTV